MSLVPARVLGFLVLVGSSAATSGCELVFGLDDYAQGEAGGGSSTSATAGTGTGGPGPSGSTGASSSDGGAGAGTGGDSASGPTTTTGSTSTGTGGGCTCVPDGWTLVHAFPTQADAPALECPSGVSAKRALDAPTVGCECSCGFLSGTSCAMACWNVAACDDATPPEILDAATCADMNPAQSCLVTTVRGGAITTDVCAAASAITLSASNAFDVCTAAANECADACAAPPAEGLWCVQGDAGEACPDDWPDSYQASNGGTPTCDCQCIDETECGGTWAVANGTICLDNVDGVGTSCTTVSGQSKYSGFPPFGNDAGITGACTPSVANPPGTLPGATDQKLCCRPL